jgi:hypothetical protein
VARGDERLRSARSSAVHVREESLTTAAVPDAGTVALLESRPFQQMWSANERIDLIAIRRYAGAIHSVTYELAGVPGVLCVAGWDGSVDGSPDPASLRRWSRLRATAAAAGVILGGLLLTLHALRGPFYAFSVQTIGLGVVVVAMVLVGARLFSASSVRRRWERLGVWRLTEAAILVVVGIFLLASRRPSLEHARALESSNRDRAIIEYHALRGRERDAQEASAAIDRLALEELATLPPEQMWPAIATHYFYAETGRLAARESAEQRTLAGVNRFIASGDFSDARSLLRAVRGAAPDALVDANATTVDSAEATSLWALIQNEAPVVGLPACNRIADLQNVLPAVRRGEKAVTAEAISRTCDRVRRQEEARVAKERQEQEARLARERREAERQERLARAAAERERRAKERVLQAWAYAPLLCNDGTLSPSCVCGQSSRRGCCSWHGGVSGCSREYPSN